MGQGSEDAIELVDFIAKSLVSDPDAVNVTTSDDGRTLELETSSDEQETQVKVRGHELPQLTLPRPVQVRIDFEPLRLPGGTVIFTLSRHRFMKQPGQRQYCSI